GGGTLKRFFGGRGWRARALADRGAISWRLAPPQLEVELQFCDDPQIAHALRCQNAADECSSAVTPRSRMRHKSREVLHSPRYHHDRVKRRRRRGDARRMSLFFPSISKKDRPPPTSKNQPERARCCFVSAALTAKRSSERLCSISISASRASASAS